MRRWLGSSAAAHDTPIVRAGKLSPSEARRIRLAYELGAKPVAAWTVVRLSGDVASAFSQGGDPALVRFHGALAANGLAYWRGLIANVMQLISTLIGLVLGLVYTNFRPDISSAEEFWARLRAAFTVSPRWVYRETRELIGQGGKAFESGPRGSLRSLLQPDGTITTHARQETLADITLMQRHSADIDAWLRRLLEGWRVANIQLQLMAVGILIALAMLEIVGPGHEDTGTRCCTSRLRRSWHCSYAAPRLGQFDTGFSVHTDRRWSGGRGESVSPMCV